MKNVHIDLAETRDRNEIGIIYVPLHNSSGKLELFLHSVISEKKQKKKKGIGIPQEHDTP